MKTKGCGVGQRVTGWLLVRLLVRLLGVAMVPPMSGAFLAALFTTLVTNGLAAPLTAQSSPAKWVEARLLPAAEVAPVCERAELRILRMEYGAPLRIGVNRNALRITVRNEGKTAANGFFFSAALCPEAGPCTEGPFPLAIGTANFAGNLQPGQVAAVGFDDLRPTLAILPGRYRLRLLADPTNVVAECSEGDNVRMTEPVQLQPVCQVPDFVVTTVGPQPFVASASKGQVLTATVTIFNQGAPYVVTPGASSGKATPAWLRMALVDVKNPSVQFPLFERAMESLASGKSQSIHLQPVVLPSGLVPGAQYRWRAVANFNAAVGECSLENNSMDNPATLRVE